MDICREVKGKEVKQKIKFTYEVPESYGINSTMVKHGQTLTRKRTAKENRIIKEWDQSYETWKNEAGEEKANEYTQLAKSFQQMLEDQTPNKNPNNMYNPFLSLLGIRTKQPTEQGPEGLTAVHTQHTYKTDLQGPHL